MISDNYDGNKGDQEGVKTVPSSDDNIKDLTLDDEEGAVPLTEEEIELLLKTWKQARTYPDLGVAIFSKMF